MQNSENLRLGAPTLPKGGGALTGLSGNFNTTGPDGAASLSVALPISAGRGFAPSLALVYNSQAGNGPFGMGWQLTQMAVRRRTRHGVPNYQPTDEFVGPDGEVLVPALADDGSPQQQLRKTLLETVLDQDYRVSTYRCRLEQDFSRLEYWVADDHDFWVIYAANGQVHLLGSSATARISHPAEPGQTAQWLLESSVTPQGEQLLYHYRGEDDAACDEQERQYHPQASAQRYLSAVHYGNRVASLTLPGLRPEGPAESAWLFALVLDYGERDTTLLQPPPYQAQGPWPCRPDCFSDYAYGFDLRTRRLCRQVLMFHHLQALSGHSQEPAVPALVSRLLLEYDEQPSVTTLLALRQVGYENDSHNTLTALPPLEFAWQTFTPPEQALWQVRDDLHNLNPQQPYQWLDLKGDGLSGVLYQDRGAWWYREPIRAAGEADGITWADATPMASIPSLRESATLVDLTGEGRVQWVVTAAGVTGYYDRAPGGDPLRFTPLQALPLEYSHPRAQLTDLMGKGFTDMLLIGPRSVRLYAGNGKGWNPGQTVLQADGIVLPVPDADPNTLIAFSDMLGSGQQHLVQVQSAGVTCWPNLGHGRFGSALTLRGFSQPAATFNPQQVYLADIDGSGTTDLIYAHADRLQVYLNQSGNGFAAPFDVELPAGTGFDRTCSLQVADIQGLGIASLLLSCPHPTPRHWVCHLAAAKPWLLTTMNNNMGAHHRLQYRSSAQFWLDEKALRRAQGAPAPVSYLPMALHLLWRNELTDEISGNRLSSETLYQHGVWDGREREFRGFGYVEHRDSVLSSSRGTASEISMPALTRSWFATGLPEVDAQMPTAFWQADSQAFDGFVPRFTVGEGETETLYTPDEDHAFWLNRALKGLALRSEVYGQDGSAQASVPYAVTEQRLQVRLIEASTPSPVVWSSVVESRTTTYERIPEDPQCQQQIVLCSDRYGYPLRQVAINYPRRAKPSVSPYPDTLPATLFDSSYDDQQQNLYLTLEQQSWHHLDSPLAAPRVLGLAGSSRTDVFTPSGQALPPAGLKLEDLLDSDTLLGLNVPRTFAGQQQIWYLDAQGLATRTQPSVQALVAFTEIAVLDEAITQALAEHVSEALLEQAGYQRAPYLFANDAAGTLWVVRQGHTEYAEAAHFWRPLSFRHSLLTGKDSLIWDRHDCMPIGLRDAAGLTTHAVHDYRFLIPMQVTDANDNVSRITLDALGRVTSLRFWGTEQGRPVGYSQNALAPANDIDNALQLTAPLPAAEIQVYAAQSWMPAVSLDELQPLGLTLAEAQAARLLTEDGRLRALWSTRPGAASTQPALGSLASRSSRQPPHVLTLKTDRYDDDPAQQIRQQVAFSDGFGRLLQAASRQAPGDAWVRQADGSLARDNNGPLSALATQRWAVTGRTEYDNKGQAIRSYQPYFLNDWHYVSDDSARQDLWADTHQYDPLGRIYQVLSAKGFLRRTSVSPWFSVLEDENDTA